MIGKKLLLELLEAEDEDDVIALLLKRGLFDEVNSKRWIALGNMPNNQSVVHAQQSNPAAALVENNKERPQRHPAPPLQGARNRPPQP